MPATTTTTTASLVVELEQIATCSLNEIPPIWTLNEGEQFVPEGHTLTIDDNVNDPVILTIPIGRQLTNNGTITLLSKSVIIVQNNGILYTFEGTVNNGGAIYIGDGINCGTGIIDGTVGGAVSETCYTLPG